MKGQSGKVNIGKELEQGSFKVGKKIVLRFFALLLFFALKNTSIKSERNKKTQGEVSRGSC